MIRAYITNLGKYNEGELCGEFLEFPATREEVQSLLSRIGVDGVLYEEIFITDYETDVEGLHSLLGEYESLDDLNYLASLLSEMDEREREKLEAALAYGEYTSNIKDLINLAQNLDCYEFLPGVDDEDDLGRYYADELGSLEVPEHLRPYIDYEAYGRDISLDSGGLFTGHGYIEGNRDSFIEHYDGRNMPDECRILSYPKAPEKVPIREQLEMYGKMVSSPAGDAKPSPTHSDR